ncbi:hypothetical protein GH733_005699 [Mirounga leonina]|nr:hypothetical protein GH733_005699 [Mirounga leonina]
MPVAKGMSVPQTLELLTGNWGCLRRRSKEYFVWIPRSGWEADVRDAQLRVPFENGPCLISDNTFDELMVKLNGFFQSAKASKIETRMKVDTVHPPRGPVPEASPWLEYGPCVVASGSWSLLLKFLQNTHQGTESGNSNAMYSPAKTVVQHVELFSKIRKQQQVPVAGIR